MKWIIYLLCFDAGLGMIISNLYIYANFSVFDVLIIIGIFVDLFINKSKIPLKKLSTRAGLLLFLFAIWQLFALLIAQGNMLSGLGPFIRNIYFAIVIIFLVPKIDNKVTVKNMIQCFVLGVLVHFIYVIYLWNIDKRYFSGLIILNNNFLNRNTIYYYAVFAIPFVFFLINISDSKRKKLFHILTLLFITSVGFFTLSKGAWLLIALTYALFLFRYIKSFKLKNIILVLFLSSSLLLLVINTGIYHGFMQLQFSDYNISDDLRLIYKKDALSVGMNNIAFGVGTHNYRDYLIQNGKAVTRDAHNATLMIFAENGLVGLILYLWIHIVCLRYIFMKKRKYKDSDSDYIQLTFSVMIIYWILSFLTGNVFTTKLLLIYLFVILTEYPKDSKNGSFNRISSRTRGE